MEDVAEGLNLSGLGLTPMWNDSKNAADDDKSPKVGQDWGNNSGPITLAAPPRGARYVYCTIKRY